MNILQEYIKTFIIFEAKSFLDKEHDWDEVLIDNDKHTFMRKQIKDYYIKNIDKIFPYIENNDIIVVIGIKKNKNILKRNTDGNKRIHIARKEGIDDNGSFEYWINRRIIEFHRVVGKITDFIWCDIDIHDGKEYEKLFNMGTLASKKISQIMQDTFGGTTKIWHSGKTGIHVEGYLQEEIDTDFARKELKSLLDKAFENDDVFTTGIARKGQIRLDVTTLKDTGSIRAQYSMSVTGDIKRPL